ncbi:MAG: type II secretion system protein [Sedimentisphaerales bacterium]|nr:type II secretion system protein [Sedimentisphaerales bacterium]
MHGRFKKGFTLLELLVVIGIISFLLSLIVPALGRAKDQSKIIVCRSNQKNLLLGCLLYANDYDSSLPVDKQLYNPHLNLIKNLADGKYISDSKVYYCPSERADELKYSQNNFSSGNIGYFYYCFSERPANRYLSTFFLKKQDWPRLLTNTMNPDKWVFSDSWFSNMPTAHHWYQKGVNYVTLDGSVHMIKESPRRAFR